MRRLAIILVLLVTAGCEKRPSPPSSPSPGGSETITGRERIGWDQQAGSTAELATFGYAIFVDGSRSVVAAVSCAPAPSAAGFACTGLLPAMSAGTHAIQLATFVLRDGETLESERSATLNVVVSASAAGPRSSTPTAGAIVLTSGGAAVRIVHLAEGLEQPSDMAIAPDGRVFIAEAPGRISIVAGGRRHTALEPADGARVAALAVALDPQFTRNGFVYVVRAVLDGTASVFQLLRYREAGGTLGEAAVLLDNVAASVDRPAAALRFGPDGRLYAAFEERRDAPPTEGGFNGKVLRLNPDGTTPRDQRGATPVLAAAARRPRGVDWDANGMLWIVDGDAPRTEWLLGIRPDPSARTPGLSYALPVPFGATSAVFESTGNLLIGAETARCVLRIRFDPSDRLRVLGTERLLEGAVDAVRAIAVAADGSIYVCTNAALIALKPHAR